MYKCLVVRHPCQHLVLTVFFLNVIHLIGIEWYLNMASSCISLTANYVARFYVLICHPYIFLVSVFSSLLLILKIELLVYLLLRPECSLHIKYSSSLKKKYEGLLCSPDWNAVQGSA